MIKRCAQSLDIAGLLPMAKEAAVGAGKAIMQIYGSVNAISAHMHNGFPSTKADSDSHNVITGILQRSGLPILSEEGARIDFKERKHWDYFWLVDPLDGTKEFLKKNDEFTVNIALIKKQRPVCGVIYVPCTGVIYFGSEESGSYKQEQNKLIRFPPVAKRSSLEDLLQKESLIIVASRSHISAATKEFIARFRQARVLLMGSSLKFMWLLENKADLYPRLEASMEWDTAAAQAILHAANRDVYHVDLKSELSYNKPDLTNPFFIAI